MLIVATAIEGAAPPRTVLCGRSCVPRKRRNEMRYCVDNNLCPFKIQSGSFFECNAVEYCAFQRPNALAISHTAYDWCACGIKESSSTSKLCPICGKIRW